MSRTEFFSSFALRAWERVRDKAEQKGATVDLPEIRTVEEAHERYAQNLEYVTGSFALTIKWMSKYFDKEEDKCKVAEFKLKKHAKARAFHLFWIATLISQNMALARKNTLDKFASLAQRFVDRQSFVLRRVPVLQESILDLQLKAMDQAKLIKNQITDKDKLAEELAATKKQIKSLEKKNHALQSEVDKKTQLKPADEGPAKKQSSIRDIQQLKKTAETATQQEAYAKTMLGRTLLENESLKKEVQSLKAAMEALKLSYDVQAQFGL